ncbi:MAG: ribonuclease P protein component [Clostridia bacterium]|nr:ribonuclease P protein component [Clostridia bacterium]
MKITKIKENYLFRRAYNKAKTFVGPFAVIYIMKNRRLGPRLGITAGKKIGKAVSRNRAKRLITAAFRDCLPKISGNYDIIIVARPRILTVKSTAVKESFMQSFSMAGVFREQENE